MDKFIADFLKAMQLKQEMNELDQQVVLLMGTSLLTLKKWAEERQKMLDSNMPDILIGRFDCESFKKLCDPLMMQIEFIYDKAKSMERLLPNDEEDVSDEG